jgi:predicted nucleic acid-binding protein
MTFLDSSVIIHYLDGSDDIVEYVDDETSAPYLTSSLCIYEVLMGAVHTSGPSDLRAERSRFGWVTGIDLTEAIAVEAARLQAELERTGDLMTPRDVLIAATARSTGDEFVVVDSDFETAGLREMLPVTTL